MSKRVEVTYKCVEPNSVVEITEVCLLLEDSDEIYANHPDSGVWMIGKFGDCDIMMGVSVAGLVMFEDADGLFGLLPENIISIKEI